MPASAATARTVSPDGPSRTSTSSAAPISSRSMSVLGVRRRPAVRCAGLMVAIIAYPGMKLTSVERRYMVIVQRSTGGPDDDYGDFRAGGGPPALVDPGGALPQRAAGR